MPALTHLHFGPGKLGLGLIIRAAVDAGFQCYAVSHTASKLDRHATFELIERGAAADDPEVPLVHSFADAFDELRDDVRTAIAAAKHLLMTTSVSTAGLASIAPFLLEVAAERSGDPQKTTVFIAGENDPGPTYDDLVAGLRKHGVDCRETVVDRLCAQRKEAQREGVRVVHADSFMEWYIQGPPETPVLAALAELKYVRFVDDIKPFEVRKRWLVNAIHAAIALLAKANNQPTIEETADSTDVRDFLARLGAEVTPVLEQLHPELAKEDNAAYLAAHVDAWQNNPDKTKRVMRRLCRYDLVSFFVDLDRKLGDMCEQILRARGELPAQLRRVVDDLHTVVTAVQQYYGLDEYGTEDAPADQQHDEDAVERYGEFLARVGLTEDLVETRRKELGWALGRHREGFDDE